MTWAEHECCLAFDDILPVLNGENPKCLTPLQLDWDTSYHWNMTFLHLFGEIMINQWLDGVP